MRGGPAVRQLRHELGGFGTSVRIEIAEIVAIALDERGADRVRDQPVRERRLTGVRAHGDCDRAERASVGNVILAEPRLADAGFAFERDDAPVNACAGVGRGELRPLAVTTDEQPRGQRARNGDRWLGRRHAPLVHRLVQLGRLRQGPHPELAVEQAHALAVLPERLRAPPDGRQEFDQAPVRGLVEWIEQQAPARVGDRVVVTPGRGKRGRQARERSRELPLQHRGGRLLPAVECDAVAQAEAGQQIVSMQRRPRWSVRRSRRRAPTGTAASSRKRRTSISVPSARE